MGACGTADTLEALFEHQARRPARLVPLDAAALSPFERALLVANGTVTQFIESYTGQPIEVVRLEQDACRVADATWLQPEGDEPVVQRRVSLRGAVNGAEYVRAHSLLAVDRLPETVRLGLDARGSGLGRLMQRARLETFRELLWFGGVPHGDGDVCPARAYRVWHDGRALMLINEVLLPACRGEGDA